MKKHYLLSLILLCILSLAAEAQTMINKPDMPRVVAEEGSTENPLVMTVDGKPVYADRFLHFYEKKIIADSMMLMHTNEQHIDNFVDLQLRVKHAENIGWENNRYFDIYLGEHLEVINQPYLLEAENDYRLAKELYDRMSEERHVSHIILGLSKNPTAEDSISVYTRIQEIRKKALAGEDFNRLALQYSEDPMAKTDSGDLGFIVPLETVYEFESMAYRLELNEISEPFRTEFGVHIMKVSEIRPTKGGIQVSQITQTVGENNSASKAKKKIWEAYEKLDKGIPWEEVLIKYTDDSTTVKQNGAIPMFKIGVHKFKFQEAAFALNPGMISEPFYLEGRWYILRCDAIWPLSPYNDEIRDKLRAALSTNRRLIKDFEANQTDLVERLKVENGYKENTELVNRALALADKRFDNGTWSYDSSQQWIYEVMFEVDGIEHQVAEFLAYVQKRQNPFKADPVEFADVDGWMHTLFVQFRADQVIAREAELLPEKYPEYKAQFNEYRDGTFSYMIMDSAVWTMAELDTAGFREFYEANKSNYVWDERAYAFFVGSPYRDTLYKAVEDYNLWELDTLGHKANYLRWKYNKSKGPYDDITIMIDQGYYQEKDVPLFKAAGLEFKPGIYEFEYNNIHYFAKVLGIIPPTEMTLEDARGMYMNLYQGALEQQLMETLRAEYEVEFNEEGLEFIKNEMNKDRGKIQTIE